MTDAGDQLLPLMTLARRWGWSRSKLWRLVQAGSIPHLKAWPTPRRALPRA